MEDLGTAVMAGSCCPTSGAVRLHQISGALGREELRVDLAGLGSCCPTLRTVMLSEGWGTPWSGELRVDCGGLRVELWEMLCRDSQV